MGRKTAGIVAAVALMAPAAASAIGLQLEGFYGLERPPTNGFSAAIDSAANTTARDLYRSSLQLAGGNVLLNLNGFELGAIIDTTFGNDAASQTAIGGLVGFAISTGTAKLDLLAEAGGHRFGNFADNPDIVTSSSSSEWLAYVGLRPGVSFRVAGPVTVGLWTFVRWDLERRHVPVTVRSTGGSGTYNLGGTTIGATVRLGFGF